MAMFMIQLGEILPGGVGSGLYGMVVMAVIAVFVAGLMVGRTPEYLGKKIEAREVKFAMLAVLILPLSILGFAGDRRGDADRAEDAREHGRRTASPRSSTPTPRRPGTTARPSRASAEHPYWNATMGIAMLLGRFGYVMPVLAMAGVDRRQAEAGSPPPAPCRPTARCSSAC